MHALSGYMEAYSFTIIMVCTCNLIFSPELLHNLFQIRILVSHAHDFVFHGIGFALLPLAESGKVDDVMKNAFNLFG